MEQLEQQLGQCSYCGGSLHPKILSYYDQIWGDETYRFENVPALVCAACGEIFFTAEVDQAMDRALQGHPEPKRFVQVPVVELSV